MVTATGCMLRRRVRGRLSSESVDSDPCVGEPRAAAIATRFAAVTSSAARSCAALLARSFSLAAFSSATALRAAASVAAFSSSSLRRIASPSSPNSPSREFHVATSCSENCSEVGFVEVDGGRGSESTVGVEENDRERFEARVAEESGGGRRDVDGKGEENGVRFRGAGRFWVGRRLTCWSL